MGERILEFLDKTKIPTSVAASMKLYDETVAWVNSSADMMLALAEVVEQAEYLTRNDSFMRELEDVDEQTFEFVKLLARSKEGDALDFSELPTYTAVYLRHERQRRDVELGGMEAIEAYVEKATKVGETLAPPFRTQQARLRRAFERMNEAGKVLAPIPQRRLTDLRNSSSGLAIISLDLVDAGRVQARKSRLERSDEKRRLCLLPRLPTSGKGETAADGDREGPETPHSASMC